MSVSKRTRFEVFKRDKFTCQYCGKSAPDIVLHIDHIEPKASGGSDDILNLVTSCQACNLGKADRRLSDDSAVTKKRNQLQDLEARREQIEMMLEWQRELSSLGDQVFNGVLELWHHLFGPWEPVDSDLKDIRRWINSYGPVRVTEAIRLSASQYVVNDQDGVPTSASVDEAHAKVGGILRNWELEERFPWVKDRRHIVNILRKRLQYVDRTTAEEMLDEALQSGVNPELLHRMARGCRNWTHWRNQMRVLLDGED